MFTVHIRINDAATGKPTPVRLRLVDGQGWYHAPFGRLKHFAVNPGDDVGGHLRSGAELFAYIDGSCEVPLPAGTVFAEVHKGPEYVPLRRELTLGPGKISLRLAVERWVDLRSEGWYSGDTRAVDLSPHAALLDGAAEGLAFVNLLARETVPQPFDVPAKLPNLLAFSGTQPALANEQTQVVVNTLNTHPFLGTLSLLNCHRVVYPLRFGGPDLADDWSLADWCDQCHRKKGLVVWPHLPRLTEEHPQPEALACVLLGKVDAFEVSRFDDPEPGVLADYYRLLNVGCRTVLAGGSGKDSNAVALGAVRTYARLPKDEPPTYAAWIEAVRAGRTFVTNGPLLSVTADGVDPGATLTLPAGGRSVAVRIEARSATPFDEIEVLHNGRIVGSKTVSGNRLATLLEVEVPIRESGWLAVRCWSRERLADGQCVYAHTSPVWIEVEERPFCANVEAFAPLHLLLDDMVNWIRSVARCDDRHKARLSAVEMSATGALFQRLRGEKTPPS
jgi:hypothetical protein